MEFFFTERYTCNDETDKGLASSSLLRSSVSSRFVPKPFIRNQRDQEQGQSDQKARCP